jgi:hypothetical protein
MPNIDLKDHPQIFQDRPQQIWVITRVGDENHVHSAYATEDEAEAATTNRDLPWGTSAVEVTLHRQSLQPIYGGPTLLEALWAEMDRLMAGLMTGQDAEDGGDKYRAQELAWVLAIVTNAYNPSIDAIRAEAVRRWNEEQTEEDPADRYEENERRWEANHS